MNECDMCRHVPWMPGHPGDTWKCPACGKSWLAIEPDYSGVDGLFIEWEEE